jgi:nitrite reductase/ring-hydroxylating ferredoxin subunit
MCTASGNVVALTFAEYPQLQSAGGSVKLSANGYSDPTCQQSGIIVFNNGGTYTALSSSCTHACCTVSISGSELRCPCHGATFSLTGQPTNSVARKALPSLPVCSDACGVYVTT